MTKKDHLLRQVEQVGLKFPSRQRFVLNLIDGELGVMSTTNKGRIQLKNEKFFDNKTLLISGQTALLDIVDCQSAEEYVDKLLDLRKRWGLDKEEGQ